MNFSKKERDVHVPKSVVEVPRKSLTASKLLVWEGRLYLHSIESIVFRGYLFYFQEDSLHSVYRIDYCHPRMKECIHI